MAGGMGGGQAAGAVLRIAGAVTGGIAAKQRRSRYEDFINGLQYPDATQAGQDWFNDLDRFYDPAAKLSAKAQNDELTQSLALRERALPSIGKATQDALGSISPLLRGELPQGVLDSFARAGGASSAGLGFGGSGFGFLNTGLFGARGALGAIQTGVGLLPTLLQSMPQLSAPTTMGLLGQLLTPQQRSNLQLQINQQKIGLENSLESLPTALDSWSSHLNESGAMLMGSGGGGGGLGGVTGSTGPVSSNGTAYTSDSTLGAAQSYNQAGAYSAGAERLGTGGNIWGAW